MSRLLRAIALAVACAVPASGAAQAATEGTVTGQVLISPIAIGLAIHPSTVPAGTWASAHVSVTNQGKTALVKVAIRLRVPDGVAIKPAPSSLIRQLGASASVGLDWSLCGRRPGAYLVFAEATVNGIAIDSPVRLLTVTSGTGSCGRTRNH